ncbi:hypothetical protein MBLNU230_g6182t1 [Neophaeotheca triangularis]
MSLQPEQVALIRATVPVLKDHGNAITERFYHTLLTENPSLNSIFNQANQANHHQAAALAGSLYAYASHIDDLGALSPALEKICAKHASLYVRPEQYHVVGTYLLRAMGEVLGEALTPDILQAWTAAYWQLANLMIKREDALLENAHGWRDWRNMRIAKKVPESDVITSFYLEAVDGAPLPAFLPGQYVSVLVDVPKLKYAQPRQYSLSDAPDERYYRVSVKKEIGLDESNPQAPAHPGYVSNVLHDEKGEGDVVKVSHPQGDFFLAPEDRGRPVVLISAGVGVTPMVSILNTLLREGATQPISWIHGARSTNVVAFAGHARTLAKQYDNVNTTVFVKSPAAERDEQGTDYHFDGRVRFDVLDDQRDLLLDSNEALYFICGPSGFMAAMSKNLVAKGVGSERVRMEVFGTGQLPG